MELREALTTTGAVREFTDEPVDDAVVGRILDVARFAPSGGNRQGWRVVVVKDPEIRRQLRDGYLPGWYQYLAQAQAGLVPWAVGNDREAEARAMADADDVAERSLASRGGFAEHLDEVPVLAVLLADLTALSTVDRDLDRYTMVGGASIYPFAWSILLAAHDEGLAGVMTTMSVRDEAGVKALLHVPDHVVVAGVLALGHPRRRPRRLRRRPVEAFATQDRFDGPALGADGASGGPA